MLPTVSVCVHWPHFPLLTSCVSFCWSSDAASFETDILQRPLGVTIRGGILVLFFAVPGGWREISWRIHEGFTRAKECSELSNSSRRSRCCAFPCRVTTFAAVVGRSVRTGFKSMRYSIKICTASTRHLGPDKIWFASRLSMLWLLSSVTVSCLMWCDGLATGRNGSVQLDLSRFEGAMPKEEIGALRFLRVSTGDPPFDTHTWKEAFYRVCQGSSATSAEERTVRTTHWEFCPGVVGRREICTWPGVCRSIRNTMEEARSSQCSTQELTQVISFFGGVVTTSVVHWRLMSVVRWCPAEAATIPGTKITACWTKLVPKPVDRRLCRVFVLWGAALGAVLSPLSFGLFTEDARPSSLISWAFPAIVKANAWTRGAYGRHCALHGSVVRPDGRLHGIKTRSKVWDREAAAAKDL